MLSAVFLVVIPAFLQGEDSRGSFTGRGKVPEIPGIDLPNGTVSVNDGDIDDLCGLNGIGETLAAVIIADREANGPFWYPEDLTGVKGIGAKKLSGFRDELDLE